MTVASLAWPWLLPARAPAATTTYTSPWTGGTIAAADTAVIEDGATITGNVVANGTLRFNRTTSLTMSGTISGSGAVSLTNTGTVALTGLTSGTGRFDLAISVAAGQLTIGSSGANALVVGHSGTGSLSVMGGRVANGNGFLGLAAGGLGAATVASGTWSNSRLLHVGFSGPGSLTVTGGEVTNTSGVIGNTGGTGTVTISGGTWINGGPLYIGGYTGGVGTGTLEINGGRVSNSGVGSLGNQGGTGIAIIRGGTWANAASLLVGRSGTGTVSVTGGMVTTLMSSTIGTSAGGGGSVNVTGGTFSNAASLTVGGAGTGTLTISGSGGSGGVVVVGGTLSRGPSGTISLESGGTLQIGTGSSTGWLATDLVNNGSLIFNRTGAATISNSISGTGALSLLGGGTFTFSGTSSSSGPTVVGAGRLIVAGALGSTAVSVGSGGLLGGAGAIGGEVAIGAGGTLSPGDSIESLSAGAVTLLDGSTLAMEIDSSVGVAADLLRVAGDFSLSGTVGLSITDLSAGSPAFPQGTMFSLVNYDGAWNGGLFRIAGVAVADGGIFTVGGQPWLIDYDATLGGGNFAGEYLPAGSFVNIVAVPEPSAGVMLVLGLAVAGTTRLPRKAPSPGPRWRNRLR